MPEDHTFLAIREHASFQEIRVSESLEIAERHRAQEATRPGKARAPLRSPQWVFPAPERAWGWRTLSGTKVGRRPGSHLWAGPDASGPPHAPGPAGRSAPALGRWPAAFRGGRGPQRTPVPAGRDTPGERPPRSLGCDREPPPTAPAAFPACPAPRRPRRAGRSRDPAAGPQLRRSAPGRWASARAVRGAARARRPSALTMATPRDLQHSAASARRASRGQVTPGPPGPALSGPALEPSGGPSIGPLLGA